MALGEDHELVTDIDRSQPWQTQRAEELSRAINHRSAHTVRMIRWFFVCVAGLAALLVVTFVVVTATGW